MQKQPSEGLFKRRVMRNFAKFTGKICATIFFLIMLNSVDLQLH